jgi:hypothetical protein
MEVIVQDANNIIIDVDQGRAGRGISTVNLITVGADYYLQFVYTDGTTEQVGPVATTVTELIYAEVRNAESVTILKGQPVYLYQAQGNLATVKLAYNTSDATSAKTLGLAAENIAANAQGLVLTQGTLAGIDTSAYAEGTTLYLGATPGTLTSVKPKAPNHLVYIGVVERANAGAGQIYVRVQNGFELDEIHDVQINSPANGQTIIYDAATDLWKNANLTAGTGISITNDPGSITISAPDTGTVTSVNASGGTTGLTFSGGPITSSGTLTMAGTLGVANGGTGLTSFTANGVVYASSTSALTTGSALTFNGTNFVTTGNATFSSGYRIQNESGTGTFRTISSMRIATDANGIDYDAASFAHRWLIASSEQMRLNTTGLGIGTSSPTAKLTVFGGAKIGSGAATNNATLMVNQPNGFATGIQLFQDGQESWIMEVPASSTALRWTASGTEQMRLTSAGNLGIGTSSPTDRLQVEASLDAASGAFVRNTNTGSSASGSVSVASGVGSISIRAHSAAHSVWPNQTLINSGSGFSGGLNIFQNGASPIKFWTDSSERMRLDSSGNLGIGTTSPSVRLDVQGGSINTSSWVTITPTTATNNALYRSTNTGGTFYSGIDNSVGGVTGTGYAGMLWHTGAYPILFGASNALRMTLTSAGNLGIGVTSPVQRLEVNGSMRTVAGSGGTLSTFETDAVRANHCVLGADASGSFLNATFSTGGSAVIRFQTTNTEQMRLTSTGLGIGTTSPGAKLESSVTSAGATAEVLRLSNPGAGVNTQAQINFYTTSTSYATITGGYGASAPQMTFNLPSATAGNYVWQITGTERMRLDTSGNLGLGFTPSAWVSTSRALQVLSITSLSQQSNGSANVMVNAYEGSTNNFNYIIGAAAFRYNQSVSNGHTWHVASSGTAGAAISFSQAMILDASGNLGIGTSSPTLLFQVGSRGGMDSGGIFRWGSALTGNNRGILSWDTNVATIGAAQNLVFCANSETAERMRLDTAGNLGIGTSSPQAKLSVAGSAQSSSATLKGDIIIQQSSNALAGAGGLELVADAASSGYGARIQSTFNGASAYDLSFQLRNNSASWTQQMLLDRLGNLGLGVTPSAWNSTSKALQVSTFVSVSQQGNGAANFGFNFYEDAANTFKYSTTDEAGRFSALITGGFGWFTAPSGTAGNAISFTQAMTLDANGRLLVGNTTATGARIDSQGTVAGEFSGLNITNLSTDVSATTTLTIGAAGGSWVLTNTRTGASLISSCAGTERFRITNGGNQIASQPAESAQNTSVTLTVANLQTRVITSNAAVTLTLPTGTSLEGYTTSMAADTAFEVTFIATTANAITIAANGNTTVGNLTVSGNTSGTFRFRKTALNTFTVYRVA